NLELIDTKKELEKTKEREEIYKKYFEEYKKDTEEKLKLIKELQLSQNTQPTQKIITKTEQLSQKQAEIISLATNLPEGIISSEYQLEVYREKLSTMLKTLYQINPEKALFVINKMLNHPSDIVKANLAYSLAEIANELTIEMLFKLYQEKNPIVKQEALRQLIRLEKKIKNNEIEISEETKNKIITKVKEEKSKGEWLF
ncbi:MAG: HEAT repeat domain-containing protein, partial [Candidatus Anstonellales archaeon]